MLMPTTDFQPDPNLTHNDLVSVNVWNDPDGGVVVDFPRMDNGGLRVAISDTNQGVDVNCDLYDGATSLMAVCQAFNTATGEYMPSDELQIVDSPDGGFAFRVPMMADQDYVSITTGGTEYMAQYVVFSDAPGLRQINPADGTLSSPVTETVGMADAAAVAAALG